MMLKNKFFRRGGGGGLICVFSFCFQTQVVFSDETLYTGIINLLPDSFILPALGVINIIYGDYYSAELGGLNVVESSLSGAQVGGINIIGSDMTGLQFGLFLNSNRGDMKGAQIGIVNLNDMNTNGFQSGLLNVSGEDFVGVQAGAFNYTGGDYAQGNQTGLISVNMGLFTGAQTGGINVSAKGLEISQVGGINYAGDSVEGSQSGIINIVTGTLTGLQIGLFNYAESLDDDGFQMGLLSVVRDGGYFAFETAYSNLTSMSFRMMSGARKLYSILSAEINIKQFPPTLTGIEFISVSFGMGTILNLGYNKYLILEAPISLPITSIISLLPMSLPSTVPVPEARMSEFSFSITALPKLGISFSEDTSSLSAGPVFTFDYKPEYMPDTINIAETMINRDLRLTFGFEIALRIELTH